MNIEWHLARIYRERNQVIHEAKHSFVNKTLTANLRHYLAFSLAVILNHFGEENNTATTVDEVLTRQKMRFENLTFDDVSKANVLDAYVEYDFIG